MTDLSPTAARLRVDDMSACGLMGVAGDTLVLTLDGALPVAHLYPGDRVITRRGAQPVASITRVEIAEGTPIVEIGTDALGGKPERDTWLPASQRVLVRDWRAKALYGQAQVCVPIAQITDGSYIRLSEAKPGLACYQLSFGRPEIIYADGLEIASADELAVPARA